MNEENCIVCLDKYEGSKEEHLENCRRFPVIVTSDIPPTDREISRLYLMDMDHIEFTYCDCILYDRNGNPNCRIHQGKLQEFYDKPKTLFRYFREPRIDIKHHIKIDNRPLCNTATIGEQIWEETKHFITCKNCLRSELVARRREIAEAKKKFKWEKDKHFYKMEEFKAKGEIKDLQ